MTTSKTLSWAASVALTLSLVLSSTAVAADKLTIDPTHTGAVFKVLHQGFANTFGRFNDISGVIELDQADITKSSVQITIQTASVDTNMKKRDDHLRSPDFFNAKEFPEMTFVSTGVEKTGDNTAKVQGDLTLLGVTKPVTLDMTVNKVGPDPKNRMTAGFSATTSIKRTDYGMSYGLKGIGDDITIWLEVEAKLKN